jgi:urease accessory protein
LINQPDPNGAGFSLLCLQQFADSALPIGGSAHSFGLESLVGSGFVGPENLECFLTGYLEEAGTMEAAYCAASCELAGSGEEALPQWFKWNTELGARKPARESRDGSAAMGRRFLQLATGVSGIPLLESAAQTAAKNGIQLHLAPCFGLVAGAMNVDSTIAASACLQQSVTALISCCQRLMALGQTRAQQILWNLKPAILQAAKRGSADRTRVDSFTFLIDVASARHPGLHTRLFIS